MKLVCAVLAAGGSTRMGEPKQLLPIHGQPLVRHVAAIACASRCQEVAVVLGAEAARVADALRGLRATVLYNDAWSSGMSTSLHSAVHWAERCAAEGLLIAACDQPLLTVEHLDALCAAFERERRSIASAYEGTLGVPALISARSFEALVAIRGDRGAASVLRGDPDIGQLPWPEGALDLDTPADMAQLVAR